MDDDMHMNWSPSASFDVAPSLVERWPEGSIPEVMLLPYQLENSLGIGGCNFSEPLQHPPPAFFKEIEGSPQEPGNALATYPGYEEANLSGPLTTLEPAGPVGLPDGASPLAHPFFHPFISPPSNLPDPSPLVAGQMGMLDHPRSSSDLKGSFRHSPQVSGGRSQFDIHLKSSSPWHFEKEPQSPTLSAKEGVQPLQAPELSLPPPGGGHSDSYSPPSVLAGDGVVEDGKLQENGKGSAGQSIKGMAIKWSGRGRSRIQRGRRTEVQQPMLDHQSSSSSPEDDSPTSSPGPRVKAAVASEQRTGGLARRNDKGAALTAAQKRERLRDRRFKAALKSRRHRARKKVREEAQQKHYADLEAQAGLHAKEINAMEERMSSLEVEREKERAKYLARIHALEEVVEDLRRVVSAMKGEEGRSKKAAAS